MTRNRNTNINDMVAQRRELDRQIRAAKRAEAKAAKAALLSARQDLGLWLTQSVGADTIDGIERLRAALKPGQIQQHLRQQVSTPPSDTSEVDGGELHDDA